MNLFTLLLLALVGWLAYKTLKPRSGKSPGEIAGEYARRMTERRARERMGNDTGAQDEAVQLKACPDCGIYRDPAAGPCTNPDCPARSG
jgi:hypothetical protein